MHDSQKICLQFIFKFILLFSKQIGHCFTQLCFSKFRNHVSLFALDCNYVLLINESYVDCMNKKLFDSQTCRI